MNYGKLLIIAISLLVLLPGCANPTPAPSPTPSPIPTPLSYSDQVVLARQKWESKQIKNYHITMAFYENFARGYHTEREVTVKNGQVVSFSCADNRICSGCGDLNCPAFLYQRIFTVEDLFQSAEQETQEPECIKSLSFNEVYGFPSYIIIDCPVMFDDEHDVNVVEFSRLDE